MRELCAGYENREVLHCVSFDVLPGEIMGLVGESGCGKSTLLRTIMGMPAPGMTVNGGNISFEKQDLFRLSNEQMRHLRGSGIALVFQNPAGSLNPLKTVLSHFADSARDHSNKISRVSLKKNVLEILERLSFDDPIRVLNSYPFELSGGMNQRIALALAVYMQPRLLLADEPTSALDATIQAQVMDELLGLRKSFGTAIVLVTHSMGVVARLADRIGVMYSGRLVELGARDDVLYSPLHPYTKALLQAVPRLGELPRGIPGSPSVPGQISGCTYAPRCAISCAECCEHTPALKPVHLGHLSACLYGENIILNETT